MKFYFPKVTRVFTTPDELRRLADLLQAKLERTRLGEDVPSVIQYGQEGTEVHFTIDQDVLGHERRRKEFP